MNNHPKKKNFCLLLTHAYQPCVNHTAVRDFSIPRYDALSSPMHLRSMHPRTRIKKQANNLASKHETPKKATDLVLLRNSGTFINIRPVGSSRHCRSQPLLQLGNGAFDHGHGGDVDAVGVAVEEGQCRNNVGGLEHMPGGDGLL